MSNYTPHKTTAVIAYPCLTFCVQVNFFPCPVCKQTNCLTCKAIHMGKNCKEYQDELKAEAAHNENAQKDKQAIEVCLKCVAAFDGLMLKTRNSSVLAMELRLFCIKPSICLYTYCWECKGLLTHWDPDRWPSFCRWYFQIHFLQWKTVNYK